MKAIVKDPFPYWDIVHQTIACRCGTEFRGRAKMKSVGHGFEMHVDRQCPNCGDLIITRVSDDPETTTIGGP